MEYVTSKVAQDHFKVSGETLRAWADKGIVKCIKTDGGHRRYGLTKVKEDARRCVYARVSSRKQITELQNQTNYLEKRYPDYEVITDIGSGINFKRPGFKRILESLFQGNIEEVVVTSGDRFSRFGRDLFEWIFEKHSAKLTILNSRTFKSNNEELSADLMEIITVFTARYYGKRKYNSKKDENISE